MRKTYVYIDVRVKRCGKGVGKGQPRIMTYFIGIRGFH